MVKIGQGVYILEVIYIWKIVIPKGWHLHHETRPQGPYPWVMLEVGM